MVFFIPSGRESEFQFSTQQGLEGIAAEAQCRRLLAVRCNKPHSFPAMQALQEELSPIAISLKPRDMREDEQIPYMALEVRVSVCVFERVHVRLCAYEFLGVSECVYRCAWLCV